MLGPDRPRFNATPPPAIKPPPPETEHATVVQKAIAVRNFVAEVGGLENARRALEMLALLSKAA